MAWHQSAGHHAAPQKSKPFYLDYMASRKYDRFLEVRYRVFPYQSNPSDSDVETIMIRMNEQGTLKTGKRLFAKGNLPAASFDLVTVTDLSGELYGIRGVVEKLTRGYVCLNVDDKLTKYPPDAIRHCHIGDHILLAMCPTDDECNLIGTQSVASEAYRYVANFNEKLKPCVTNQSITPEGPEAEEVPVKTLVIFLDKSFVATIEKYPSTLGKERLIIHSQRLLFPTNEHWANQVRELSSKFSSWRKSRGDGNCYYRAVAISYLEEMLRRKKFAQLLALYLKLLNQEDYVIPMGFEDHHYYFLQAFGPFVNSCQSSERIVRDFQALELDYAFDNAMIGVFRCLAAHWLEINSQHDEVFPFIMDTGVDPILRDMRMDEKEGEGLAFVAMANALGVTIHHIIADQTSHRTHTETFRPFSGQSEVEFSLLLRPGHYDLIYRKDMDDSDHYDTCQQDFN